MSCIQGNIDLRLDVDEQNRRAAWILERLEGCDLVTVTFQIANTNKARIMASPPTATTDANGEATVTIEGVASRGSTTLRATWRTASDTVAVKVPDR